MSFECCDCSVLQQQLFLLVAARPIHLQYICNTSTPPPWDHCAWPDKHIIDVDDFADAVPLSPIESGLPEAKKEGYLGVA